MRPYPRQRCPWQLETSQSSGFCRLHAIRAYSSVIIDWGLDDGADQRSNTIIPSSSGETRSEIIPSTLIGIVSSDLRTALSYQLGGIKTAIPM